ncbi:TonB family protein (plasmid) [Gemmatirosa kalamazoonensis]|jgi:TonB family protein|uniref:TonB family protein n=1 Tax=Gemmatirosa kalamazoonensis TaxID=861299 RepID=W0RPJ9_9BACT|nr:energy transducer TonB [Gemmatirosa kalamazoonensis]AHG92255.1 TonB family protein [Gemmatirosa kalamazoonensis]
MFTRFSMPPQRRDPAPVAGSVASLAAHATLVVLLIGGGPSGTGTGAGAAGAPASASAEPAAGERIQWVGSPDADRGASAAPSTTRPPIAYVVPGRGPLREVTAPVAPRRRPTRGTATSVPPMRPPEPRRLKFWQRQLLPLPPLPEVDVALLVAGVVAAAPDLDRLVTRPEDFHRLPTTDPAELLALANVLTPNGPRPVGPVDVLPIAFVSNPKPTYPMFLAQSGVGGRVLVEFTIDSAGVVDLASLQVVRSTNDMFTQAVRAVLPQLRFLPAQISQHAVGVRVRQPFEFRIGSRN